MATPHCLACPVAAHHKICSPAQMSQGWVEEGRARGEGGRLALDKQGVRQSPAQLSCRGDLLATATSAKAHLRWGPDSLWGGSVWTQASDVQLQRTLPPPWRLGAEAAGPGPAPPLERPHACSVLEGQCEPTPTRGPPAARNEDTATTWSCNSQCSRAFNSL